MFDAKYGLGNLIQNGSGNVGVSKKKKTLLQEIFQKWVEDPSEPDQNACLRKDDD